MFLVDYAIETFLFVSHLTSKLFSHELLFEKKLPHQGLLVQAVILELA